MRKKTFSERGETGFVSFEILIAVAFSFVFLAMMANLIAIQFGRGVVRAAADEGARAGARLAVDSLPNCQMRAQNVLDGIGGLATNKTVRCGVVNGQMQAIVTADFDPWIPLIPRVHQQATGFSLKEGPPA